MKQHANMEYWAIQKAERSVRFIGGNAYIWKKELKV